MRTRPGQARCLDCERSGSTLPTQSVLTGRASSMVPFYTTAPPSVHAMYTQMEGRKGRTLTEAAREWINAWKDPCLAHFGHISRPVRLYIDVDGGDGFSTQRDLDNILKICQDLLAKHAGVLQNDTVKHVRGVRMEYHPPKAAGAVHRVGIRLEQLK